MKALLKKLLTEEKLMIETSRKWSSALVNNYDPYQSWTPEKGNRPLNLIYGWLLIKEKPLIWK